MDLNGLPFDDQAMLKGLRPWVECESPTFEPVAVGRMMELAARDFATAGAQIDHIAGRGGFGPCVRARFPGAGPARPGILVLGHFDTVHPVGTIETLYWRQEGDRCYGPGIYDMKGGTYLALEAVRQLARAGIEAPLPVTFLLTSDEEVGTPTNRELIEEEARRNKYVLVPEPGGASSVVSGRYAIARFNLEARGRPSHAGASLKEGRSALRYMARKILEIEEMTTDSCTFSVGVINSGRWVNCVPSVCRAEALSMAKRQTDLDAAVERLMEHAGSDMGITFDVARGVTRPVWEPDAGTLSLYERARALGRQLGLDLGHESVGGGSDGNFTGALGIPTLDGLGVVGHGAHTLEEHIVTSSLSQRGRLFAGLVATLT